MKIRKPDLGASALNTEHESHGLPPAQQTAMTAAEHPVLRTATWFTAIMLSAITLYLAARLFLPNNWSAGVHAIVDTLHGSAFWSAVAVGLLAQAVDGALGMAYGVTASTFLLLTGLVPRASYDVQLTSAFAPGVPVWRIEGQANDAGVLQTPWNGKDGRLRVHMLGTTTRSQP